MQNPKTDTSGATIYLFFAPTASAYRQLSIFQLQEYESRIGEPGTWAYSWSGRDEVGGFATPDAAYAAGMADGESRNPGLRLADGTENAYASVRVHDDTGL